MIDDPIVDEVRKARQRIFAECGGQLERLIERFKAADSQNERGLVTPEDVKKRSQSRTTQA